MAHAIRGERFRHAKGTKPGWHNLGREFLGSDPSASEAVREIVDDIHCVSAQHLYQLDDGSDPVAIPGRRDILLLPTADDKETRYLGTVTDQWEPVSYLDMAKNLDKLSESFPVETAAVLDNGERVLLSFRDREKWTVGGDDIYSYYVFVDSLKPGKGRFFRHTPIRNVCANTEALGKDLATVNLHIPHTKNAEAKVRLAADLVVQFSRLKENAKKVLDVFAATDINVDEFNAVLLAAYPNPLKPSILAALDGLEDFEQVLYKKNLRLADPDSAAMAVSMDSAEERWFASKKKAVEIREAATEAFEEFDGQATGTVWAAYNAVTEISDWRSGRNADQSLLLGARSEEKVRAFDECAGICAIDYGNL